MPRLYEREVVHYCARAFDGAALAAREGCGHIAFCIGCQSRRRVDCLLAAETLGSLRIALSLYHFWRPRNPDNDAARLERPNGLAGWEWPYAHFSLMEPDMVSCIESGLAGVPDNIVSAPNSICTPDPGTQGGMTWRIHN